MGFVLPNLGFFFLSYHSNSELVQLISASRDRHVQAVISLSKDRCLNQTVLFELSSSFCWLQWWLKGAMEFEMSFRHLK